MHHPPGLRFRRSPLRGVIAALFVAAVLLGGSLVAAPNSEARGGLVHGISAYYNPYDMRVYVYGDGFTPDVGVEVWIAVDNGDGFRSDWQVTSSYGPYGEIALSFGPYCPHHVSLKAVDKTGKSASFEFTTYACPW